MKKVFYSKGLTSEWWSLLTGGLYENSIKAYLQCPHSGGLFEALQQSAARTIAGNVGARLAGRKTMSAQRKTRTVNLRIEPEAHELIARAADVCGKSITAFMTEASLYSAKEELLDQRFIGVSADVFETVSEKLSAPGVARDRLVKLFESHVEWMD
jgi:uncharacterized protein (DUF1778 family)